MKGKVALLDQYGAFLGVKQGRFVCKLKEETRWEAAPIELDSIIITTDGVAISSAALSLAATFGIDVVLLQGTRPVARLLPYKYGTLMRNWLLQLKQHESSPTQIARLFLEGKLHNQRMVILEYARRLRSSGKNARFLEAKADELLDRISELGKVSDIQALLTVEAHAAKAYWEAISSILPHELGFSHRYTRSDKPDGPLDAFNIALNIGYALLRKEVWRAIFLAGLNPYVGFLHKPRGGRPALILDLMEEFRPVCVDRPLIGLARTDKKTLLKIKEGGEAAIRGIWSYLIKYMRESNPPHQELINSQARKLVLHLQGVNTYQPYKSRW